MENRIKPEEYFGEDLLNLLKQKILFILNLDNIEKQKIALTFRELAEKESSLRVKKILNSLAMAAEEGEQ